MLIAIFLILISGFFFLQSRSYYHESKSSFLNLAMILGISAILIFVLLFISKKDYSNINPLFCLLSLFFILIILYIQEKTKPTPLEVVAKQQRYWNEITPQDVYNFYSVRKQELKNRVNVLVNEKNILFEKGIITPQFIMDYYRLEPTKIENLEAIEKSKLYTAVFKKVKEMINNAEAVVHYEEILKKHDNYVEFFLLNLWETYSKKVNIGIAYLEILATNDVEREFIGALDLTFLFNMKRKGAVLYFKYMKFKEKLNER